MRHFSIKQKAAIIAGIVLVLSTFYTGSQAYVIVPAGHVGVVTHFGAVQDKLLQEGLHSITPFESKVHLLDSRVNKVVASASASSKDLQIVTSQVALNYYLSKEKANIIFQELGDRFETTIIQPTIQESVKSSTAKYTAEELITRRSEVKDAIFKDIKQRLGQNNIIVTDFSIVDFNFSKEFNRAIEEKQVAEQKALRARNDLTRIKTEAEQERAKAAGQASAKLELAKAEAEAQRLLTETLNADIIKLRTLEKWDGQLPTVMGSSQGAAFYDVVGALSKKQ